jgi:serine/threonine protein kinase
MPVPLDFLHSVGTHALPLLAGTAAVAAEIGSSILGKVWDWWGKKGREEQRRKELEALAGMTSQQVKEAVREVVADLAKDHPPATQAKLEGYLMAVPAQIRRTLRRPSDSAGLTVPPDLRLSKAEDLAPLLPPRPPRFTPGQKAPGSDFELVELLGIGGFGEVWKARNTFMPGAPPVALKFCLDPEAALSLRRETTLLDRIQREGKHPGIVELRNTFLSSDPPYLEYELVEGGDLGGLIHDWHREKGGPNPDQAARVVRRLAEIVAFAHAKGIVHRDLKPANILLAGDRRQETGSDDRAVSSLSPVSRPLSPLQLKVADFGIGGIAAEAAARQARLTLGGGTLTAAAAHGSYSLYYASPEQMRGAFPDPRDDVHALGVIWYQVLVGDLTAEAPRGAGWKKRLAGKGMSAPLIELLESCVASEREDRPKDAGEVAERIAFLVAEPAPDIDLTLVPEKRPETRPEPPPVPAPAPVVAKPPAPVHTPVPPMPPLDPLPGRTAAEPGVPRALVVEALRRSRWIDFVNRLRDIRAGHYRLRWSAGLASWLVPLAIIAGAAVIAGVQVYDELQRSSYRQADALGRQLAAQYSAPNIPIEWYSSYRSGYFRLKTERLLLKSEDPKDAGKMVTANLSSPSLYSSSSTAHYSPVQVTGYSSYPDNRPITPEDTKKAEEHVRKVNEKMAAAASEINGHGIGRNDLLYGWIAGVSVGVLLLVGFVFLRRWAWRKLEESQRELIATTETEYALELRELPELLDLRQPSSITRLVAALEQAGSTPKPIFPDFFPTPLRLFHRFCAPF